MLCRSKIPLQCAGKKSPQPLAEHSPSRCFAEKVPDFVNALGPLSRIWLMIMIMIMASSITTFAVASDSAAENKVATAESTTIPDGSGTPANYPPVLHQRLDQDGVSGTLVIHGGGSLPADVRQAFIDSLPAGRPVVALTLANTDPQPTAARDWIEAEGIEVVAFDFSTTTANVAEPVLASGPLAAAIREAGGVWIEGDSSASEPSLPAEAGDRPTLQPLFDKAVMAELSALLNRRGVIGAGTWEASILGRQAGEDRPATDQRFDGFGPLSDAIVRSLLSVEKPDNLASLRQAVEQHPTRFGFGLDRSTAAVIRGRQVAVVGTGVATIVLAAGPRRPPVEVDVPAGSAFDLTQIRRASRWRGAAVDPGKPVLGPRRVDRGSLVIVGGGGMPKSVVDRFVSLAGGRDARIVVLPTAVPRPEALRQRVPRFLARADVAEVTMLPQSRTDEIESEPFAAALRRATGVWFDGGRQWNFVDAYENTSAVERFRDVLRRGGVIGGSSAGATIQGEYLVRGHPLGNRIMMAEGYERGFGFLPGVAIDQHFSQRGRHADLVPVIARHPELLGIGIDESTALVVTGSRAEVIGDFAAHFLASGDGPADDDDTPPETVPPFITVTAGEAIDLLSLQPLDSQPDTE